MVLKPSFSFFLGTQENLTQGHIDIDSPVLSLCKVLVDKALLASFVALEKLELQVKTESLMNEIEETKNESTVDVNNPNSSSLSVNKPRNNCPSPLRLRRQFVEATSIASPKDDRDFEDKFSGFEETLARIEKILSGTGKQKDKKKYGKNVRSPTQYKDDSSKRMQAPTTTKMKFNYNFKEFDETLGVIHDRTKCCVDCAGHNIGYLDLAFTTPRQGNTTGRPSLVKRDKPCVHSALHANTLTKEFSTTVFNTKNKTNLKRRSASTQTNILPDNVIGSDHNTSFDTHYGSWSPQLRELENLGNELSTIMNENDRLLKQNDILKNELEQTKALLIEMTTRDSVSNQIQVDRSEPKSNSVSFSCTCSDSEDHGTTTTKVSDPQEETGGAQTKHRCQRRHSIERAIERLQALPTERDDFKETSLPLEYVLDQSLVRNTKVETVQSGPKNIVSVTENETQTEAQPETQTKPHGCDSRDLHEENDFLKARLKTLEWECSRLQKENDDNLELASEITSACDILSEVVRLDNEMKDTKYLLSTACIHKELDEKQLEFSKLEMPHVSSSRNSKNIIEELHTLKTQIDNIQFEKISYKKKFEKLKKENNKLLLSLQEKYYNNWKLSDVKRAQVPPDVYPVPNPSMLINAHNPCLSSDIFLSASPSCLASDSYSLQYSTPFKTTPSTKQTAVSISNPPCFEKSCEVGLMKRSNQEINTALYPSKIMANTASGPFECVPYTPYSQADGNFQTLTSTETFRTVSDKLMDVRDSNNKNDDKAVIKVNGPTSEGSSLAIKAVSHDPSDNLTTFSPNAAEPFNEDETVEKESLQAALKHKDVASPESLPKQERNDVGLQNAEQGNRSENIKASNKSTLFEDKHDDTDFRKEPLKNSYLPVDAAENDDDPWLMLDLSRFEIEEDSKIEDSGSSEEEFLMTNNNNIDLLPNFAKYVSEELTEDKRSIQFHERGNQIGITSSEISSVSGTIACKKATSETDISISENPNVANFTREFDMNLNQNIDLINNDYKNICSDGSLPSSKHGLDYGSSASKANILHFEEPRKASCKQIQCNTGQQDLEVQIVTSPNESWYGDSFVSPLAKDYEELNFDFEQIDKNNESDSGEQSDDSWHSTENRSELTPLFVDKASPDEEILFQKPWSFTNWLRSKVTSRNQLEQVSVILQ